jgi:hypothetical protein
MKLLSLDGRGRVRVKIGGYRDTAIIKYLYPSPGPSRKGSGVFEL